MADLAPQGSRRPDQLPLALAKGGGRNRSGQSNFEMYGWLFMRLSGRRCSSSWSSATCS